MPYVYLAIAILFEVAGTTALKSSEGFTRLGPSAIVVVGYSLAFYFMSLTLKSITIGVTYAIWCAGGIVLIACLGWWVHDQKLDFPAILGMALIVLGVVVIQLFSKSIHA